MDDNRDIENVESPEQKPKKKSERAEGRRDSRLRFQAMTVFDIGASAYKIVRINARGKILRAVCGEWPDGLLQCSEEERMRLKAQQLKKAARKAGIYEKTCVAVVGGPDVIIQHFVWPELPREALLDNALNEIAVYLPGDVEQYNVDYKITAVEAKERDAERENIPGGLEEQETQAEGDFRRLRVKVAAIRRKDADEIVATLKAAGFRAVRLELRENARGKISSRILGSEGPQSPSYAVLDLGHEYSNVSVYVEGSLYINRYMNTAGAEADKELGKALEIDAAAANTRKRGITLNDEEKQESRVLREVYESLMTNVSGVLDYAYYRERKPRAERLIIIGGGADIEGIVELAQDQTGIAVEQAQFLQKPSGQVRKSGITASRLYDMAGAALVNRNRRDKDLNLISRKKNRKLFKRVIAPLLGTALLIGGMVAAGIILPGNMLEEARVKEEKLAAELAALRENAELSDKLKLTIDASESAYSTVDLFNNSIPRSDEILEAIRSSMQVRMVLREIKIDTGAVVLTGETNDLLRVSQFKTALEEHFIVGAMDTVTRAILDDGTMQVGFSMKLLYIGGVE